MSQALLDVQNLQIELATEHGALRVVDGVDFRLEEGQTLGVVGESGCGKSITALAILGVLPRPAGRVVGGAILWNGVDLTTLPARQMRDIRGKSISMILQDPMTSLNPVFTCGNQIAEGLRRHEGIGATKARRRAIEMLELVGIPTPEQHVDRYPHEFSGGMRQRVMIAIALACRPRLLIADEPTTALDVTVQAQILELIDDLKRRFGMATLLISHDMGVIAERCQRVAVMYAGKFVETADTDDLFVDPKHPYTIGLLASMPRIGDGEGVRQPLRAIPGAVPNPRRLPPGCSFSTRCERVADICRREAPALRDHGAARQARCWQTM